MNTTRRWLLPFSWGVDMQAIDAIVRLAASEEATLIALSLLPGAARRPTRKIRAEHLQQSQDFLEAVRWKSLRHGVHGEAYELATEDVQGSIATLVHELACDRIILVSRGKGETLLHTQEVKALLREQPAPLMLLYFPERPGRTWPWPGRQLHHAWSERLHHKDIQISTLR
jgi:hypothetical protein